MRAAGTEVLSANAGVAGTMMHGPVKADNDNEGAYVRMCESCGVGDRRRRRVARMQECMEMG